MRQKKIKSATIENLESQGVIVEIQKLKLDNRKRFLEIGSGKGQFITAKAKDYPDHLWIAMEVNINVCYRILEKKLEMNLDNLVIVHGDAQYLEQYFDYDSVDGLYLNFSDPWPKKRHHKRRLTAPSFLKQYCKILKKDAFIQFRTDHLSLFQDSLEYIEPYLNIKSVDYDLDVSAYMTEYEEKKRELGPIYQLIGEVEKHVEENL
ncbi:MAG: tRNA (guanosine(46)-N7)-methyltransferase TrmB [Tenericutes bacterium]|nr:tRNA (guanosine(46)-N7)-methyltransferase TrmB [Mycoplasmatota bacterium]